MSLYGNIRNDAGGKSSRLMVVAPHPDDFDAMGVTLKFLSDRGSVLKVVVACTGSGVEESYRPGLTLAGRRELREREQRNSARFFGLPAGDLVFPALVNDQDDQVQNDPRNLARLEDAIVPFQPDVILLPHGNDTNGAHRAVYAMVRGIASRSSTPMALWLSRDPKTISMRPDLVLPFGEAEAAWKAELLKFHDSQHQRNLSIRGRGFDDRILDLNRQIARELALDEPFAESFEREWFPGRQVDTSHP